MTPLPPGDYPVLARDVRSGDRVLFGRRSLEVWRTRPAGRGVVALDLHGLYLRLAHDQPLCVTREHEAVARSEREPAAA